MLGNVKRYSRIYLTYGYTALRYGIDGLARVVQDHFSLDPFQKGCLFCSATGRQTASKGFHAKATASCLFNRVGKFTSPTRSARCVQQGC